MAVTVCYSNLVKASGWGLIGRLRRCGGTTRSRACLRFRLIQSSPDLSIYRAGPSQVPLQYARRYPKRAGSETGRNALAGIGRPSRIDRSWFSSPKSGRFRPSWSSRRSACRHCLATLPITSNGTLEAGFRFALAADPTTCHRAPCRLDKHERITKLAICDSSARPPGAHRQARCAHAAHNLPFHSPVSPGHMVGRRA